MRTIYLSRASAQSLAGRFRRGCSPRPLVRSDCPRQPQQGPEAQQAQPEGRCSPDRCDKGCQARGTVCVVEEHLQQPFRHEERTGEDPRQRAGDSGSRRGSWRSPCTGRRSRAYASASSSPRDCPRASRERRSTDARTISPPRPHAKHEQCQRSNARTAARLPTHRHFTSCGRASRRSKNGPSVSASTATRSVRTPESYRPK